ncbi:MAG: nicotinate phosphoribosyltransferase, partial [Nitrososphaerales archaeon]
MSSDLKDRTFWISKDDEIKQGKTTDVYFVHTRDILKQVKKNPRVTIEVFARSVEGDWGVVTGIYEVAKLLEGMNHVNVRAMEEGEIFLSSKDSAIYEPVMQIEANYADIAIFENPVLGFVCFSSGVSSKAAKIRLAAGEEKTIFSFGTRRAHPALAPTVERAAYVAGFDDVSNTLGAELIGIQALGTMPHALILAFNDQREAWRAFDEFAPKDVKRIALVDTLFDEKTESIMALDLLKEKLDGVRLDTPSSRRGHRRKIIEE